MSLAYRKVTSTAQLEWHKMAMNRIQFQAGLSMPEFPKDYGTEAQCKQALQAVRWPNGFCCPRCGHAAYYVLRDGARKVL